jgi:hypothetical protein
MAQVVSAAGELQIRLPVPGIGPQPGSHIPRQLFSSVVRPADLVVGPRRGEHLHQGAALVGGHHSFLSHRRREAAYRSASSGPPISASTMRQPPQCE